MRIPSLIMQCSCIQQCCRHMKAQAVYSTHSTHLLPALAWHARPSQALWWIIMYLQQLCSHTGVKIPKEASV